MPDLLAKVEQAGRGRSQPLPNAYRQIGIGVQAPRHIAGRKTVMDEDWRCDICNVAQCAGSRLNAFKYVIMHYNAL